jgi:hypothetical protein
VSASPALDWSRNGGYGTGNSITERENLGKFEVAHAVSSSTSIEDMQTKL